MEITVEEVKSRLREGEVLELKNTGGAFQVWVEPYANPPSVYYEGTRYELSELDQVAESIVKSIRSGENRFEWIEEDDD